jgi:hypothetical protein
MQSRRGFGDLPKIKSSDVAESNCRAMYDERSFILTNVAVEAGSSTKDLAMSCCRGRVVRTRMSDVLSLLRTGHRNIPKCKTKGKIVLRNSSTRGRFGKEGKFKNDYTLMRLMETTESSYIYLSGLTDLGKRQRSRASVLWNMRPNSPLDGIQGLMGVSLL